MSATGTAIQIPQGRPRGAAVILTAMLAAALGIGFFAGRVTETVPASSSDAASVTIPAAGWDTGGANVRSDIYGKSVGDAAVSTVSPAIGGFAPHMPKRAEASEPSNQGGYANRHLPKQWHL